MRQRQSPISLPGVRRLCFEAIEAPQGLMLGNGGNSCDVVPMCCEGSGIVQIVTEVEGHGRRRAMSHQGGRSKSRGRSDKRLGKARCG